MPLLDWQHSPEESVISGKTLEYFKLYWIIGASLTIVVLTIWGLWIWWNIRREAIQNEEVKIKSLDRRSTIDPELKARLSKAFSRWKPTLWRRRNKSKRIASQSGQDQLEVKRGEEQLDNVRPNDSQSPLQVSQANDESSRSISTPSRSASEIGALQDVTRYDR